MRQTISSFYGAAIDESFTTRIRLNVASHSYRFCGQNAKFKSQAELSADAAVEVEVDVDDEHDVEVEVQGGNRFNWDAAAHAYARLN